MTKEIEEIDDLKITDVWKDYEKGVMYNRMMHLYDDTEDNYDFYYGNQWKNAKLGNIEKVCLNVINSVVKYKTGVLSQNTYSVIYNLLSENAQNDEDKKICELLGEKSDKVFENERIDSKARTIIKDACINDEGIFHNYYDTTNNDIKVEIVNKNNICYGNENESNIQLQPYIILSFRRNVNELKEEARSIYNLSEEEIEYILPDNYVEEQAGMEVKYEEITPMCLVLLKYYKKNGKIYYTKCTKFVTLEEERATDMTLYPIAHFLWEEKKGSSRGIGEVRRLIPNQIEINKTIMRRIISVQLGAHQKLVVNEDFVKDISTLNKVGAIIKVKGGAGVEDIRKQVGYLNPTSMSPDSKAVQEELINYTQNFNGSTSDEARGNIDPTKASGKAILAVQQATQQPLNEQQYRYKEFLEDEARILLEIWKAYEVNGLVLYTDKEIETQDEKTGMPTLEKVKMPVVITQEQLQNLKANIKVDITPISAFDIYAQEESLENLFIQGKITFEEYVEALPSHSAMPKDKLQKIIKKREEVKKQIQMQAEEANNQMNQIQQALQQRQFEQDINNNDIDNIQTQGNSQINDMLGGVQNAM